MAGVTSAFERIVSTINRRANWIACFAAAAMMAFVCYDVVARYLGHPVTGSNDITQFLSVILVAFAMGYTQVLKRHMSVSLVIARLSPRAQRFTASITTILSLALFILLAWKSCSLARRMWLSHEGTSTLGIPTYLLVYSIALGCVLICLVLAVDLLGSLRKAERG